MKRLVDKGAFLVLKARYKNNDDEEFGAFDSMEALTRFFALKLVDAHKEKSPSEVAIIVAAKTADLCGKGDNDECWDGDTRYWIHKIYVMGVTDVPDEEKEKPEKKGKKK